MAFFCATHAIASQTPSPSHHVRRSRPYDLQATGQTATLTTPRRPDEARRPRRRCLVQLTKEESSGEFWSGVHFQYHQSNQLGVDRYEVLASTFPNAFCIRLISLIALSRHTTIGIIEYTHIHTMKFSRTIAVIGLVPAATAFTAQSASHRGSSLAMADSLYSADIAKALDNEVSLRNPGAVVSLRPAPPVESFSRTHVKS